MHYLKTMQIANYDTFRITSYQFEINSRRSGLDTGH